MSLTPLHRARKQIQDIKLASTGLACAARLRSFSGHLFSAVRFRLPCVPPRAALAASYLLTEDASGRTGQ